MPPKIPRPERSAKRGAEGASLVGDLQDSMSVVSDRRAAQWIRSYCEPTYKVEPPFEQWEMELH